VYAIVDIETTGNGYSGMKITEISVFRHDGNKVVNEFTSLVNPECNIPPFITNLTGITNAMVANAPKFFEIAKQVNEILEDAIFVAHNVNFDYPIVKREFQELGFDFKRKKLCTVRLSRKLIPNLPTYSLGALCASQNIEIKDRHRARGDAAATVILFEQLMERDKGGIVFAAFLNGKSRQATIPPLLPMAILESLPKTAGVYYFKNLQKEIIYVGKANNIKQRVLSHFYDKAKKEITMCLETADISFTETGSELMALLLESAEIKNIYPKYNRSQKRKNEGYAIFSYTDTTGIIHIGYGRIKLVKTPLIKFYNIAQCRNFLEILCEQYELCPKYCHLQSNVSSCFHYQIKKCRGVCRQTEEVSDYNIRVQQAIASFSFKDNNFLIKEKGRTEKETAWVLIQNGIYMGYGYSENNEISKSAKEISTIIQPQNDNTDVQRILKAYLKKNTDNVLVLSKEICKITKETDPIKQNNLNNGVLTLF